MVRPIMCLKCNGTGRHGKDTCNHCHGKGYIMPPKIDKAGHRND